VTEGSFDAYIVAAARKPRRSSLRR
jgi:hypothetical protein